MKQKEMIFRAVRERIGRASYGLGLGHRERTAISKIIWDTEEEFMEEKDRKPEIPILGLCGYKYHGKDSFAKHLIQNDPRFKRIGLADLLKSICGKVFGLSDEMMNNPELKEMPMAGGKIIELDDYLRKLRTITGLPEIKKQGLRAETPRQVLQLIGTEYIRKANPDYWLHRAGRFADANPRNNIVITDVRFKNEAEWVKRRGGKVVQILRISKAAEVGGEHESETIDFTPDFTIAIMEDNFWLPQSLGVASRRNVLIENLRFFDWKTIKKTYAFTESLVGTGVATGEQMGPWELACAYYGSQLEATR